MPWLADRGLTTATTRLACDPSPGPPCRVGVFAVGRGGVSRPIEGLDSFGAVRALRIRRSRASARTLRVRVAHWRERGLCDCASLRAERHVLFGGVPRAARVAQRPLGGVSRRGALGAVTPCGDPVRRLCEATPYAATPMRRPLCGDPYAATPMRRPGAVSPAQCPRRGIPRAVRHARSSHARSSREQSRLHRRAPRRRSQRADGAEAVEPLDGARHATSSNSKYVDAAGWAGTWIAGEPGRRGRKSPVRQPRH